MALGKGLPDDVALVGSEREFLPWSSDLKPPAILWDGMGREVKPGGSGVKKY
jgi:hypothetical protein